jgi:hypothetical protein
LRNSGLNFLTPNGSTSGYRRYYPSKQQHDSRFSPNFLNDIELGNDTPVKP